MDLKNVDNMDLKMDHVLQSQGGAEEPAAADFSQPANTSTSNAISELEQLLKQKKFTRSEIVHLTELLQSRAVEVSLEDGRQNTENRASDSGRHQPFASGPSEVNRNEGIRSSAAFSTPILNSKVLEDDIATPAELAKAYMGNRPSNVSPSALGLRSQVGREDTGLLSNRPFASESPIMSFTKKTPLALAAPNGLITPRSRGRSAIYNMARTPYSRVPLTSNLKGGTINNNGYAGPSMSSSHLSLVEINDKESQPMTLKRRSSVFDDEIGSVGPIRRIRQKSNLLAPKLHHSGYGVGIGSHSKQKHESIGEPRFKVLKTSGENENESIPSTSYAHVPSKSSEVAARIFQHLEKLSPKEKPLESKLVAIRENSPSKLSPNILSGKSIRSMEDVDSSKLLRDVQNDHKLGYSLHATLPDARDSSSQRQGKVEDNGPKESFVPSDTWNPVMKNDSAVSFRGFETSSRAIDSTVKEGASQPPQKKRAFRMSAQEDYLEQDDDVHCNGLASRPFSEKRGLLEAPPTDSKLVPAKAPKLVKTTIQSEDKIPSGLIFSKTTEPRSFGAVTVGEGSSIISFKTSEEATAASQPTALPVSAAAFDKAKEANNPSPLFSSSKVADQSPSLPSESSKMAESKLESSTSLVNVSPSTGSQIKIPELYTNSQLNHSKAGHKSVKSDIVLSAASNGPIPFSSPPPVSFTTLAASNNTNSGTSTSSSLFGLAAKPSTSAGPVIKFGASLDPSSAVSAEVADQRTKPESTIAAPSSETSKFGSLFASASQAQGTSLQSGSAFNINGSTTSQLFNPNTSFGFSSSDTKTVVPSSTVPTSNTFKYGSSSSEGTFGFGFSSSSSSTNAAVVSSTSATPTLNFGANSSATAPGINTGSPSSFPFGLNPSSSSSSSFSATNSISSNTTPPNVFASGFQTQKPPPIFSSPFTSPPPSTGFSFGASSSTSSAPTNATQSPFFSSSQPVLFGNSPTTGFAASPGNNDQMSTEDSMAEDPVQSAAAPAPAPVFGQPAVATSPGGFAFGSTTQSQAIPFMFGGQQNQVAAPPNPSPFQASGSFNAGGSFSLGSGGGDKSGRRIVKPSRNKNRKK